MSTQLAAEPVLITDEKIEEFIILQLESRPLVVDSDWEATSVHLTIDGVSKTRMNRRLGSLIKRGVIIRHRRHPEYRDDDDRPVTYSLDPNYVHA